MIKTVQSPAAGQLKESFQSTVRPYWSKPRPLARASRHLHPIGWMDESGL